MLPLLFIHVPKTAGTSFRRAAIKKFGAQKVLGDYGNTVSTAEQVAELVHRQGDFYQFKRYLNKQKVCLLSGHVVVERYRKIFPAQRIITFLRDPIERVVSHYHHACRQLGYVGSLADFVVLPENGNVQSRYLANMPLEAIGFVGLTERYEESIALINTVYGTRFSALSLNTNAKLTLQQRYIDTLPSNVIKLLRENNQEDCALYTLASTLFDARVLCDENRHGFVHGKVQGISSTELIGWAYEAGREEPVEIDVLINDEYRATLCAKNFLPQLMLRNVSRDGYVGFRFSFEEQLSSRDTVRCHPKGSEQILTGARVMAQHQALA